MSKSLLHLAGRVVHGRILAPSDLRAACTSFRQRPNLGGYALGGWITEDEAAFLEDSRTPHGFRSPIVGTSGGARAALATVQAGSLQVRWFVPLIGEQPCAWLRWGTAHAVFSYLLDIGQGQQVSWGSTSLNPEHHKATEALLAESQALDYGAAFAELAVANAQYAYNEAVPSCLPGIAVEQVRLIAVCDGLFPAVPSRSARPH